MAEPKAKRTRGPNAPKKAIDVATSIFKQLSTLPPLEAARALRLVNVLVAENAASGNTEASA